MIKFITIIPDDIISQLQNRVVDHITEYHLTNPLVGTIAMWRGSVLDEYFVITFTRGVLALSLVEREMWLGHNPINFAMVESLESTVVKGDSVITAQEVANYNSNQSELDQKEIRFTDVMDVLKWTLKTGVKIDYDMLLI